MARRIAFAVAALAIVAAAILLLSRPTDPAPLPPGAEALLLRTVAPALHLPWETRGCPLAAIVPVRIVDDGQALAFDAAEQGQRLGLVFPYGYTARRVAGRGQLISPDGTILAQDGDVLSGLMGEAADNGDLIVCVDPASNLTVGSGSGIPSQPPAS